MDDSQSASPSHLSDPATWVDQHGDYLYRNALLRIQNEDLAEELVQETFLAALNARSRFSGRSSERTWLVGILKHKIVDHFRKDSREHPIEEIGQLPCEAERPFAEEGQSKGHWRVADGMGPMDWGATPSAILEQKEFWEILNACLSALPSRLAHSFTLREIEGLSSQEVCKVLNITATNLWVMLHRCRMQLRRCIEMKWVTSDIEGSRQ